MAIYCVDSVTGIGGLGDGSSWANAYLTIAAAIAKPIVAGDVLYVSDIHNASYGANTTLTFPGTLSNRNQIIGVDHTVAVGSITTANLKTGGQESTSAAFTLLFHGSLYSWGVNFTCGSGANGPDFSIGAGSDHITFENCTLKLGGTAAARLFIGDITNTQWHHSEWINVTFNNAGTSASPIRPQDSHFNWRGGAFTGTSPSNLFGASFASVIVVEGVDLSAVSGTNKICQTTFASVITIRDCKIVTTAPFAALTVQTGLINFSRSDTSGTNSRNEKWDWIGNATTSTTVARTGGASDGTLISRKLLTSANASWSEPFITPLVAVWNAITGSNVNVTIEGIADPRDWAALPNNDEFWFDVEYLSSASSPLGTFASGTKSNILATGAALTASTQAWDSAATAWQSAHTYAVGNIVKATGVVNPGSLFVCTAQTGVSSGADPFSGAVDGGTVTDNLVTWKAMWRFNQTVTLGTAKVQGTNGVTTSGTPAQVGYIYAYPKVAKASLTGGIYYDPLITLS